MTPSSIRLTLKRSYRTIICALLVPVLMLLVTIVGLSFQYSRCIENIETANTLRETIGDQITEEVWQIVSGNLAFEDGKQYAYMSRIVNGIQVLESSSSAQSSQYLQAAAPATETMKNYFDILGKQIAENRAVAYRESVMEEISSVAHLIDEILQNYIGEEIVRIGELNRQIQSTTFVMVIISFALLAMTGWYAWKSYQHVQQAIDEPVDALDKMASAIAVGDWDARTALPQVEEFRGLARHLNHMASRLEHSVAEQLIAEKNLQKAEMRTLQAQITPHFLYNTLDTIVWLAEAERNQEVMDITMALTSFLRISLSSGQDFIPVSREIEHVKSYLAIQATRYGSTMEYRIEADESLGNMQVLKLLLQPLVENAIYYGVRAKRGRGRIVVSVQRTDKDQMTFSVSDNGIGIEPEKLRALQADLSAGVRPATQSGGFGLFNVSQRIRLYYGTELQITSVYWEGTTVSFTIPCKEQENVSYISGR